ncbi:MAG: beta-lactamase family protein [Propionibacteriaceae bacterium]|jgi:CubicO group peptidase (beta-lactamase class C family)|nr:beta-lactamase family protein [Propionibacteriaceae bacterium]
MIWTAVEEVLAAGLEQGAAPGLVAVVGDESGIIHQTSMGVREIPSGSPMTPDTIFRVASQTKAVNAIAVLQLVERGLLNLSTPVGDILPDFDLIQVIAGWDGEVPRLRAPKTRARVHHLMTHTSGLTYDVLHPLARRYLLATGTPMPSSAKMACFASPMVVEPGTEWTYGMSADWTGRIVEAASGEKLDEYYRNHIFAPLGLEDICFDLNAQQETRLAPAYRRDASGDWIDTHFAWEPKPEFLSAGHGLFASAADYFAIQQVLLSGGESNGVRLLSQASVANMLSDHMGGIPVKTMPSTVPEFSEDMHIDPGATWGLDIMLTAEQLPGMRKAGSAGWAGTFNTFFWIDPQAKLAAALYMQTLPFFDSRALELSRDFERAIYA